MARVDIGQAFIVNGNKGIAQTDGYHSIGEFITQVIIPNVFVIANIILFFLILFGGFTIITNAGNGDKQKQGSAVLTAALIGFVLIFASYWLIQIVSAMTGFEILNPTF